MKYQIDANLRFSNRERRYADTKEEAEREATALLEKHPECWVYIHSRTKTYHVEKCIGEAHSNPFIDHCSICAPRWGILVLEVNFRNGAFVHEGA